MRLLATLLLVLSTPLAAQTAVPANPSRAGVAAVDASWHLGASAGQFSATGAGIARNAGFDPFGHATRKVGSDILGTRIQVRALVIEDGDGDRVAIVANDLYLPNDLLQRRLAQTLIEHDRLVSLGLKPGVVTGITGENLAMTSSHSHTSPFYSTPGWGTAIFQDVFDLRFYEYMAARQAEAVIQAVASLVPVRLGGATVPSNDVQGHTYGPRTAQDGTPAGQPYDYTTQAISLVRLDDVSDPAAPRPLANWVIFGVHPEWVWGEEIVNGDLTHAVMRMLDRETGAMTVMSQRETGASGPHKDTRVHAPQARREFQESAFAGADRAARLLTDTLKTAWRGIARGRLRGAEQFSPMATHFDVAHVSQRFAPPFTRPYPGVSNCNSDEAFQGRVGLPILGLPDCFYDHTEFTDVIVEPFFAALPVKPFEIKEQLVAAGVPIPHSYSATSFTAVEETAAVHLQVFRLGEIVALMCPCEQFTSQAINQVTRLDKTPDNLWLGYDWGCLAEARGLIPAEPAYARHCAAQQARFPETGVAIPGSLEDLPRLARSRAQIHNDAAGWEDLDYAAYAESEPAEISAIKGNFTHEEFTEQGYELVLSVGMANDYWGYMPEYRDYRSFDHYRKALNGLGPHGADYLATRLSRMAANLKGGDFAMPLNPLDAVYQAESARAEGLAQMLGGLARAYVPAYEATLPADGGSPRIVTQPATTVRRFSAAVVQFIGGSNYTDLPRVTVERFSAGAWRPYGTQDGEVQLQLRFPKALGSLPSPENPLGEANIAIPDPADYALFRAGMFEWQWTASFEAFVSELDNLGARRGITPTGRYRFVIEGQHRGQGGVAPYRLESAEFTVIPWGGLVAEDLRLEPDGRVSFRIGPTREVRAFKDAVGSNDVIVPEGEPGYPIEGIDYPDSWAQQEPRIGWIREERQLFRYGSADRADHQQYCSRCTFRPWADSARAVSAFVRAENAEGRSRKLPAQPGADGRWITSGALRSGERAFIPARALVDEYGERNEQPSAVIERRD
ncbi:MAG TPA: hypothetical protein VFV27_10065 [Nevskiaceae bacterium]|nr:hypothetical protein [Nevskiaceae bacterium]